MKKYIKYYINSTDQTSFIIKEFENISVCNYIDLSKGKYIYRYGVYLNDIPIYKDTVYEENESLKICTDVCNKFVDFILSSKSKIVDLTKLQRGE